MTPILRYVRLTALLSALSCGLVLSAIPAFAFTDTEAEFSCGSTYECTCEYTTTIGETEQQPSVSSSGDCTTACCTTFLPTSEVTSATWTFRENSPATACSIKATPGSCTLSGAAAETAPVPGGEIKTIEPVLSIPIPTVTFSEITRVTEGNLTIPFLGEYIAGVYRYAVSVVVVLAIVMIMAGGVRYIIGSAAGDVSRAKEMITNAVVGVIIALSSYVLLSFVSPRAVILTDLEVAEIPHQEFELPAYGDIELTSINSSLPAAVAVGDMVPASCTNLLNGNSHLVHKDMKDGLCAAVTEFYTATGQEAILTSGFRSAATQMGLFYNNCISNGGVCKPATGKAGLPKSVVQGGGTTSNPYVLQGDFALMSKSAFVAAATPFTDARYGAHLTGYGIDIWCTKDNKKGYITNAACQQKLTEALANHGFCRLNIELWHNEWFANVASKGACSPDQKTNETKNKDTGQIFDVSNCRVVDADDYKCVSPCNERDATKQFCLDDCIDGVGICPTTTTES